MKTRFSTIDIAVGIKEIRRFCGMRVNNVYDIDSKTYLIKLMKPDEKVMILMESGSKIHTTGFDWPKNMAPSGFSMKLRKHIKGRRLESIQQLGVDRIIDLQFGSGEAAYHVILELYDRGNIVLTDFEYTILNILRPRTDKCQDVRFAVKETYPVSAAKEHVIPTEESLRGILTAAKSGDMLKKILIPHLDYGPALIEHSLLTAGFPENCKIDKDFNISTDFQKLLIAIEEAEEMFNFLQQSDNKGYIIQKKEKRVATTEDLLTYEEFHPMMYKQHAGKSHLDFDSFNQATDEFFSKIEGQKMDMKTVQQEKAALKKLDNIKKDHEKRIEQLQKKQDTDINKGRLLEMNLGLVDQAILVVNSALANQIDWTEINRLVKEAQQQGDPVAQAIKSLKLDSNHMVMVLRDPYFESDDEDPDEEILRPMNLDIDLSLSAYANSRKFFDKKKMAAKKEQKTIEASSMALKSAEKKTKETLKEVAMAATINKTRKTYWFEKFLWFITSENFLCVGGRDQQQNEMIVKRYLKPGDLYVHADLHGASSIVIKNHTSVPIPPKSMNEVGAMAICNSAAWDAKVVTSAWWVYHDQVSKTAPSGEYLTTGSFMIRGKKNFLPPSHLVYGFGMLFKLEEGSVYRHKGERKVKILDDDLESIAESVATESDLTMDPSLQGESDNDDVDSDEEKQNDKDSLETKMEKIEISVKSDEEVCDSPRSESESKNEDKNSSDNSDEEQMFPDTTITLQHVKGDNFENSKKVTEEYELHRDRTPSECTDTTQEAETEKIDIKPSRVSAKQRREMKKARKTQGAITETENESSKPEIQSRIQDEQKSSKKTIQQRNQQNESQSEPQVQPKRGQKSKLKKIKEKYADQDEEERQLRMDILASAGPKTDEQQTKKGKKSKKDRMLSAIQPKQQPKKRPQIDLHATIHITDEDFDAKTQRIPKPTVEDGDSDDEGQDDTKQKNEKKIISEKLVPPKKIRSTQVSTYTDTDYILAIYEDVQILDSLTGCPVTEDELLYAVPVCGPYNALVNFKYKVKLQPGSTKRGKACKLALNMFLYDKNISQREKDLMKILKDADVSRNIPGKVKVSAPNITKIKRK